MDRKRILIADDEQNIRSFYRRLLEKQGYIVEEAESGTLALQRVYGESFDGAVFDNNMGGPTGLTILETLRKDERQTPVVICCAVSSIEEENKLKLGIEKAGNARYLPKPVDVSDLRKAVQELFGESV